MMRTKGEAGTGDVVEAVRHARAVNSDIRRISCLDEDELYTYAKEIRAPYHLVKETAALGRLPVVNFAAGGVATPADAALMMHWASMASLSAAGFSRVAIRAARQSHRQSGDAL